MTQWKPRAWNPSMSVEEAKDLAYWERNMLALAFADGWYNDDVLRSRDGHPEHDCLEPRYQGWRRVLSLKNGSMTFHVPDDFEIGNLPEIAPNWDGHSTEEKWTRIAQAKGIAT